MYFPTTTTTTAVVLTFLAAQVQAHFILQLPASDGWVDDIETEAPCGGFSITNRTTVTDFPVTGGLMTILNAGDSLNITVNTALANATTKLTTAAKYDVTGMGTFCMPTVPVSAALAGSMGVIQIIGDSDDGVLYQCAAVRFTAGPSAATPKSCTNDTGITVTKVSSSSSSGAAVSGAAGATIWHSGVFGVVISIMVLYSLI